MKISIITVCYNSSKTIKDCIESVICQSYQEIEYIIIDGNSTDSTLEIIKSYADKIHTLVSEKDQGMYDAINKGINFASGDVIGILNSDDFYTDENAICVVMNKFKAENVDAVYADLNYVNRENTNKIIRRWKSGIYSNGCFLLGWMPPHPTFFIKKRWYTKYKGYSLELISAADYELMLRMIHKHHVKISYVPRVIVSMRVGGMSNVSLKNRINANKEDRKAWIMNGLIPKWYTLLCKPARKLKQYVIK